MDVRSEILRTATRLFAAKGFDGTSLKDIADAGGIRKPSLLYHFPSKEQLRLAVLEQLRAMGVESVSNIGPSISYDDKDSQIYKVLNKSGITFQHEIELLKVAKEMEMVTIGLALRSKSPQRPPTQMLRAIVLPLGAIG